MPQVYLFDLDDTLVDRLPSVKAFLPKQYARYRPANAPPLDDFVSRFLELDEGGYNSKNKIYNTLVHEFGLNASVPELVQDFRANAFRDCSLQPGAVLTLRQLRARGIRLGVVTNGSISSQEHKLKASGLVPCLETYLISEAVGLRKPEPAMFREAARRFKVEPSECAFVGDHPEKDIAGAQQVGMFTVWLRHERPWPEHLDTQPTFTISRLTELLALSSF